MSGDDDEWAVDDEQFDGATDEPDDDEWRFSLEDLEDDADDDETGHAADPAGSDSPTEEEEDVGGNVFGSLQSATEELEAGSPSLENVFFVVVGIVLALLLFAQFLLVILGGP